MSDEVRPDSIGFADAIGRECPECGAEPDSSCTTSDIDASFGWRYLGGGKVHKMRVQS